MRLRQRTKFILLAMSFCFFALPQLTAAAEETGSIIISAAASLTNVMHSLANDFEKRYPDIKVIFNFGATGNLLAQMSQGAPVDIFASASVTHMDQAQEKGLIVAQSRKIFAANTLVLAKSINTTIPLTGLRDLTLDQVKRIAIGKPESVPAGQYAKEVLVETGLWETLAEKLFFANSARQVLDYLRRGEVDAALIYATDAKIAKEQVRVIVDLPGRKILYPVALAKTNQDSGRATTFLEYLITDAAQKILIEQGFLAP